MIAVTLQKSLEACFTFSIVAKFCDFLSKQLFGFELKENFFRFFVFELQLHFFLLDDSREIV